ncbi:GIY-YIG nuclease family protein [Hydrogenophaga defluvii]|uniref:GIY-YIG nuclease family protein n=1 Tax=Hydrogenophaga defluvii TaxID=249410 RepID=A0ABW2SBC9_9BURK
MRTYRRKSYQHHGGNYNQNDGVPGVVYILKNDAFKDGWIKIGQSRHSGHKRAADMNKEASTGLPAHHVCIFECRTLDCGNAEKEVFKSLGAYRKGRQEFFEVELELAKKTIIEACERIDRTLKEKEKREQERERLSAESARKAAEQRQNSMAAKQVAVNTVDFTCPTCQTVLSVPIAAANPGQRLRCKQCGAISLYRTPGHDAPPADPQPTKGRENQWALHNYPDTKDATTATPKQNFSFPFSLVFWGLIAIVAWNVFFDKKVEKQTTSPTINGSKPPTNLTPQAHTETSTSKHQPSVAGSQTPSIRAQQYPKSIDDSNRSSRANAELYLAHPDADTVISSNGFRQWLATQGQNWSNTSEIGTSSQKISMLDSYKVFLRKTSQENSARLERHKQEEDRAAKEKVRADVNAAAERAFERFPYLREPEYAHVLEKIVETRDHLISQGVYPSVALTRAVNDHAYAYDPRGQKLPIVEVTR